MGDAGQVAGDDMTPARFGDDAPLGGEPAVGRLATASCDLAPVVDGVRCVEAAMSPGATTVEIVG